MIARTWHGVVHADDAQSYVDYLRQTGFANLESTPGNLAWLGLRRTSGERAEFLLISLWESYQAIRRFAGANPSRAVFYPEDERFLIERDEHVDHFEVIHLDSLARKGEGGRAQRLLQGLGAWLSSGAVTTAPGTDLFIGRPTAHGFTYVRLP